MVVASLDEAKILLYGADQGAFVAARDTLVKELRLAKERDLASDVKALRKPSAVAAEVNRVVRADPEGVEVLLQAAELLRSAHAGLLDEAVLNVSDLQTQYRAAIKALAQTAESRKAEVRAALEAATIDVDSNDALRTGSLAVVPEPVSIFGVAPPSDPTPIDELAVRRAQREKDAVHKKAAAAAKKAARAGRAERAEQAATAKEAKEVRQAAAAAEAAKQVKKERARALANAKKTVKELTKQHRAAQRAHLDALDTEAEAASTRETSAQRIDELGEEVTVIERQIADLQSSLASLLEERDRTDDEHEAATTAQSTAAKATAEAHDAVQALATAIEAAEAEVADLSVD